MTLPHLYKALSNVEYKLQCLDELHLHSTEQAKQYAKLMDKLVDIGFAIEEEKLNMKEEANRLACTGAYKRASKLYNKLGLKEQALYYENQAKIKAS